MPVVLVSQLLVLRICEMGGLGRGLHNILLMVRIERSIVRVS